MIKYCIIATILICVLTVKPHPPNPNTRVPAEFVINLDLNYEDRWRELAVAKKDAINKLLQFLKITPPYSYVLPVADFLLDPIIKYYNTPFIQECKALSKVSGVPLETIILLQFLYEVGTHKTKMCSAILVDRQDHVFHTRNLDYDFAEQLAGLTVHLRFVKAGKTVFRVATQAGFLGSHTGIADGRFAINLNQRDQSTLFESFWHFIQGKWRVTELVRYVLEHAKDYNEAVKMLKEEKLISPAYFIISGVNHNEGAIITRNRDSVHDVYTLDDAKAKGLNYIVQTNYDRDVPDPVFDYRRVPAEMKMGLLGVERSSEEGVMKMIMSDFPNLNSDTLLTATMSAKIEYLNSTIWY